MEENMKTRCVIVGGAPIMNYEKIRERLQSDDRFIFCDSGILHNQQLRRKPHMLIGDFDSLRIDSLGNNSIGFDSLGFDSLGFDSRDTDVLYPDFLRANPTTRTKQSESEKPREFRPIDPDTEIIRLPREKDDSDTMYAVKTAFEKGFRDFLLIGVLGAMADHSLANLGLLKYIKDCGGKALLIDDYSEIEVIEKRATVSDRFRYFSLLPIFGPVSGLTIRNAKFETKNAAVTIENPYTISNETLAGGTEITIENGALLLIQSHLH